VDQTVDLYTEVTLECKVKGTPKPEVIWMRDNIVLKGDQYRYITI
jgi:hypothetical protein